MTNYFKYLKSNLSKLAFALFVSVFTILIEVIIVVNYEEIAVNNSQTLFWALVFFVALIFCVGNYQVYKEWKDGIR